MSNSPSTKTLSSDSSKRCCMSMLPDVGVLCVLCLTSLTFSPPSTASLHVCPWLEEDTRSCHKDLATYPSCDFAAAHASHNASMKPSAIPPRKLLAAGGADICTEAEEGGLAGGAPSGTSPMLLDCCCCCCWVKCCSISWAIVCAYLTTHGRTRLCKCRAIHWLQSSGLTAEQWID
jgi:hypothetical protein